MKLFLTCIISALSISVFAQTISGPGIKDAPPTAVPTAKDGIKVQEPSYIEAEEGRPGTTRQEQQLERGNPDTTNERGPKGERAQEKAKKNGFEITQEEQLRKQKHE